MSVTVIVLAGGASTRFGSDKLAAELDGSSVLATTIQAVAALAEGVIVAGSRLPDGVTGDIPIALVADDQPSAGPLAALASVLPAGSFGRADLAIVVAGDMPRVVPAVLAAMLDVLDQDGSIDAVVLGLEPGPESATGERPKRQVLPLALRIEPASRAAREAIESGERSLQSFVDRMASIVLPERRWRPLDPAGRTLQDIDTREDLDRLKAT